LKALRATATAPARPNSAGLRLETLEERETPVVFTVTATNAALPGMTLAEAVEASNSATGGANTIVFNIPPSDPGYDVNRGVVVISNPVVGAVPEITNTVSIDGFTEPLSGGNSRISIELTGVTTRLVIKAPDCTLEGLAIYQMDEIDITSDGNTIQGCNIGTRSSGTEAGFGNGTGIFLEGDSNLVTNCVVSGNSNAGIKITGSENTVEQSKIGVASNGTSALPNGVGNPAPGVLQAGIVLTVTAPKPTANNAILGDDISGNSTAGIILDQGQAIQGAQVSGTTVANNFIGVGTDGRTVIPNQRYGILALGNSNGTVIGDYSIAPGEYVYGENVIVGNPNGGSAAIWIDSSQSTGDSIAGNYLGILPDGATKAGGNSYVYVAGDQCVIGGLKSVRNVAGGTLSLGNVISGSSGLIVTGDTDTILGNLIGTNASGTAAAGGSGVTVTGSNDTLGGDRATAGNVISGNGGYGLKIGGDGNSAFGNIIGLNAQGSAAVPNVNGGVSVTSASNTTIGKADANGLRYGNIISGNTMAVPVVFVTTGGTGST
jgi:hypothetical protein